MTKLSKKLALSVSFVVILGYILSIIINNIYIDKFYLSEKKKVLNRVEERIDEEDMDLFISNIDEFEKNFNVSIAYVPLDKNYMKNIDDINESLMRSFYRKGISLTKFWLGKDVIENLKQKSVNRIYNQGKTKYSLLVKFIEKDNYIIAVSSPIEHSEETIAIINRLNIIVGIISLLFITIVIFILSNRIIKPIYKLKVLSLDISRLKFRTEDIKTNDEIEELADSINIMSRELEKAHIELNERNKNLKELISDTSHELKTPVALVKAYANGIKDGLDDGTYIDTIIRQSDNMEAMIETLLYWVKYESREVEIEHFDLKSYLFDKLEKYKLILEDSEISLTTIVNGDKFYINADREGIGKIIDNLVTNAIKYTNNNSIEVELEEDENSIRLKTRNGTDKNIDKLEDIWKPFYVLERSRNKNLSGTGIGLSIVDEILKKHGFKRDVKVDEGEIEFTIFFDKQD